MSSFLSNYRFLKMNGLGNEIVVLDLRGTSHVVNAAEVLAIAADEKSAFDQMMVLHDARMPGTEAFVRIYNNDGSEVSGCGNGTRCVAWAMMTDPEIAKGFKGSVLRLETLAGLLVCERRAPFAFTVDMGTPRFDWREIPLARDVGDVLAFDVGLADGDFGAAAVSIGNPHVVFFIDDLTRCDLAKMGPLLEHHPLFPERANVSFVAPVARDHFRAKVWERGAGATRACGTAACAIAVLACRKGLSGRDVTISLPGGDLNIVWRESDDHILMTGPVELEWEGRFPADLFAGIA